MVHFIRADKIRVRVCVCVIPGRTDTNPAAVGHAGGRLHLPADCDWLSRTAGHRPGHCHCSARYSVEQTRTFFSVFSNLFVWFHFFYFILLPKIMFSPWKKKPTVVVLLCPGVNFQPQRHLTLMFTQLSPHWLISSSVLQTLCYVLSALFISISNTQDNYLLRHEFPGQTM